MFIAFPSGTLAVKGSHLTRSKADWLQHAQLGAHIKVQAQPAPLAPLAGLAWRNPECNWSSQCWVMVLTMTITWCRFEQLALDYDSDQIGDLEEDPGEAQGCADLDIYGNVLDHFLASFATADHAHESGARYHTLAEESPADAARHKVVPDFASP